MGLLRFQMGHYYYCKRIPTALQSCPIGLIVDQLDDRKLKIGRTPPQLIPKTAGPPGAAVLQLLTISPTVVAIGLIKIDLILAQN
jgi:hypothetical protein